MIRIKRVNQENIKPVRFVEEEKDKRPVKGADIFPEIYSNIFFCARKKSGKSCAIYHIIDKCSTTETRVIAFVSTLNRDPTWKAIQDLCEEKKIDFTGYTSIKDESTKEDILDTIVTALQVMHEDRKNGKADETSQPHNQQGKGIILTQDDIPRRTKSGKPKKPKEKAPEIIFVFDDLSGELHAPSVTTLLKKNRHFKCKVLISSQYWNDISLPGRKQIDYVLLYRGLSESLDKLNEIYKNCDLAVTFDVFLALYRFATASNFHFLYIDVFNSGFRKDFTHQLLLPSEKDEKKERDL